ncbi:MAG: sodium:solute symporter family protein, partial [Oscillospiraceae bacterium]|jgi:SSS family solute:Na+ symporter|nr:sodium:solute symporter family protein [Oscillospiraceae bacterium]
VSSILLTIVMLAVGLAQMIAAGKLGQSIMGLPFTPTVLAFAAIFIVYTLAGGMNAVASTNKLHLFVMYGGVILAIVFALPKIGGLSQLIPEVQKVEAAEQGKHYFNLFSSENGVRGFAVSQILASLLGACTAQAGIQPILAAKNVSSARKACIITAFVAAPFGLFTALLGIISKIMSSNGKLLDNGVNVTDAKLALFTLMKNVHPIIGGLVLSAILAAILSTVSPIILSSGTMITKDLYQRVFRPNATDAQVLKMSRITTALAGVLCALGAIALVNASEVLEIVKAAYSLRGALFVVVLFGIYWKKASEKGACVSMVLTGITAIFWKAYKLTQGVYPISDKIEDTYAAVAVALVATLLFSYVFPKKQLKR